jgi:hypothetical protein
MFYPGKDDYSGLFSLKKGVAASHCNTLSFLQVRDV